MIWSRSLAAHRLWLPCVRADRRVGCAHALVLASGPAREERWKPSQKAVVERPRLSSAAPSLACSPSRCGYAGERIDHRAKVTPPSPVFRRPAASLLRQGRRGTRRLMCDGPLLVTLLCARLNLHLYTAQSWLEGSGSAVSAEGIVPALIRSSYSKAPTAHATSAPRTNSREIRKPAARGPVRPSQSFLASSRSPPRLGSLPPATQTPPEHNEFLPSTVPHDPRE